MENKIIGIKKLLCLGFVLLGIIIIFLGLFFIEKEFSKTINSNTITSI